MHAQVKTTNCSNMVRPYQVIGSFVFLTMVYYALLHESLFASSSATLTTSSPLPTSTPPSLNYETPEDRALYVRSMTLEAWHYYVANKFGQDSGKTIMAAITTLYVMNQTTEYNQAREWIRVHLNNETQLKVDRYAAETVKEYLGSLLSCYALTNDKIFLDKAVEIADRLESSYNLNSWDRPKVAVEFKPTVAAGEWADQVLEYRYLSHLTGEQKYMNRVKVIEKFLEQVNYRDDDLNVYRLATTVKSIVQTNGSDSKSLDDFCQTIEKSELDGLILTTLSNLTYVWHKGHYMSDWDCHMGAILILGADGMRRAYARNQTEIPTESVLEKYYYFSQKITETCHLVTNQSASGLTPTVINVFPNETDPHKSVKGFGQCWLRPQLSESYLALYRKTHDQKYREYAWELVKAYHREARTSQGCYSAVLNTQKVGSNKHHRQPPIFLSATLKYLWLIFGNEDQIPNEKWIFNSAGHPLPILN